MEVTHEELFVWDGQATLEDVQSSLHSMYYTDLCGTPLLEEAFLHGNDTYIDNRVDGHGVSNFHLCCTLNNPDLVIAFLDKGADVNGAVSFSCPRNPGFTPLHFAVNYNRTQVVELLLQNEADCNRGDRQGRTALHLACEKMKDISRKIIELLVEFGASPVAGDEKGVTPLHVVFYKTEDLRNSLIDQFFSKIPRKVNFADEKGLSFFHMVCTRGDTSRVNDFLELGISVDICVGSGLYDGYTPLHFAVMCNQTDVVELLLQNNAHINVQTNEHLLTPLHMAGKLCMKYNAMDVMSNYDASVVDWASRCKTDFAIMELLLKHGADTEAEDAMGRTPLIQACTIDKVIHSHSDYFRDTSTLSKEFRVFQKRLIEMLLSYGADIHARNHKHETALHAITKNDFLNNMKEDIVEYLIIEGADINAQTATGLTPIHLAVQFVNVKLVNLFLKYQPNLGLVTNFLATPLEVAMNNNELYSSRDTKIIISALLAGGADPNVYSETGRTLLEEAIKNRMAFVVDKLLEYGADLNAKGLRTYSASSFLKQWYRILTDSELTRKTAYCQIVNHLFIHTQKLLALGHNTDMKIEKWCIRLLYRLNRILKPERKRRKKTPIPFNRLDNIYRNCVAELKRMKRVQINQSTTLYDVLHLEDTEIFAKQIRNKLFVNPRVKHGPFPWYWDFINRQFRTALKRRDELENAKTSLDYISGIHIPEPCSDAVLKYLSTEEIRDLNIAVHISKNTQRK